MGRRAGRPDVGGGRDRRSGGVARHRRGVVVARAPRRQRRRLSQGLHDGSPERRPGERGSLRGVAEHQLHVRFRQSVGGPRLGPPGAATAARGGHRARCTPWCGWHTPTACSRTPRRPRRGWRAPWTPHADAATGISNWWHSPSPDTWLWPGATWNPDSRCWTRPRRPPWAMRTADSTPSCSSAATCSARVRSPATPVAPASGAASPRTSPPAGGAPSCTSSAAPSTGHCCSPRAAGRRRTGC